MNIPNEPIEPDDSDEDLGDSHEEPENTPKPEEQDVPIPADQQALGQPALGAISNLLDRSDLRERVTAVEFEHLVSVFEGSLRPIMEASKLTPDEMTDLIEQLTTDKFFFAEPDLDNDKKKHEIDTDKSDAEIEIEEKEIELDQAKRDLRLVYGFVSNLLPSLPQELRELDLLASVDCNHAGINEVTAFGLSQILEGLDRDITKNARKFRKSYSSITLDEAVFNLSLDGKIFAIEPSEVAGRPVIKSERVLRSYKNRGQLSPEAAQNALDWTMEVLEHRPDLLTPVTILSQSEDGYKVRLLLDSAERMEVSYSQRWRLDKPELIFQVIETPNATVILAFPRTAKPWDWAYGGIRIADISDEDVQEMLSQDHGAQILEEAVRGELSHLALIESGIKHRLINYANKHGLAKRIKQELGDLDDCLNEDDDLREHLLDKRSVSSETGRLDPPLLDIFSRKFQRWFGREIHGGRCVYVPHSQEVRDILASQDDPRFKETVESIFKPVAEALEKLGGRLKLTPDLGRNAHIGDILYQWTTHILGIPPEVGGAGGKSSYTVSGIIGGMQRLEIDKLPKETPITLVGSNGELGKGMVEYFGERGFTNVALCDPAYKAKGIEAPLKSGWTVIEAQENGCPDDALIRGGVLLTTAMRDEISNSNWQLIPSGTIVLPAQNFGIPDGQAGVDMTNALAEKGITFVPGQVLTLAGALTSRLEWVWRKRIHDLREPGVPVKQHQLFPKPLAHAAAIAISGQLIEDTVLNISNKTTSYAKMLELAEVTASGKQAGEDT